MCVILLDYLEARQNLWNGISCKWHSCHWQDNVGSQARFTFIRHHLVPFKGQRQMCRQCSLEQGVSYFEQKHLSWEGKAAKLSRHQTAVPVLLTSWLSFSGGPRRTKLLAAICHSSQDRSDQHNSWSVSSRSFPLRIFSEVSIKELLPKVTRQPSPSP